MTEKEGVLPMPLLCEAGWLRRSQSPLRNHWGIGAAQKMAKGIAGGSVVGR